MQLKRVFTEIDSSLDHLNSRISGLESQFGTIKTQLEPCTLECQNGGKANKNCTECERCDEGWTGRFCQTPFVCESKCKANGTPCECDHGGTMNKDTCLCSCPLGWLGDFCQEMDPSVSLEKRLEYLEQLLNESLANRGIVSSTKSSPVLRHHLGTGVTTPQHTVSGAPILEFTYSNRSWNTGGDLKYLIPDNIEFESISGGRYYPDSETTVYSDVLTLLEKTRSYAMNGMKSIGPQLIMQQEVQDIYQKYFGGSAFLTVSQQSLPLYKISLPSIDYE